MTPSLARPSGPRSTSTRARRLAAVLTLGAIALLSGCGDDDKPRPPTTPITPIPPLSGPLAFARADSTVLEMGDSLRICCGTWDEGFIDKTAFKILMYDPANQKGGWKLFVLPGEVMMEHAYPLPTAGVAQYGQSPVNLFVVDFERGNEAASDEEDSRGTIVVHSLSCGPPVRIDASIDAVLASEFGDGPEVRARGRFQAEAAPDDSCNFGY